MENILKNLESVFDSLQTLQIEAKAGNVQILANIYTTLQQTYSQIKKEDKDKTELKTYIKDLEQKIHDQDEEIMNLEDKVYNNK